MNYSTQLLYRGIFDHSVTFFVGKNGNGKSNLLETLAVGYIRDEHESRFLLGTSEI